MTETVSASINSTQTGGAATGSNVMLLGQI